MLTKHRYYAMTESHDCYLAGLSSIKRGEFNCPQGNYRSLEYESSPMSPRKCIISTHTPADRSVISNSTADQIVKITIESQHGEQSTVRDVCKAVMYPAKI